MPRIQNSNSTSIPANRGDLLKIVGGGSLVFAGQTLGSEVIGVFATAAPAVGKLVSCCVFCPTAAESLDSLSGITDHSGSPGAPRAPSGSVIVPPSMKVLVGIFEIGFFHVRVGSPHVLSPLSSLLDE